MHNYTWHGINRLGEKMQGEMRAQNRHEVRAFLRKQGIITRKISKQFYWQKQRIKPTDITRFSRQITSLLTAGITLIQTLNIIQQNEQHVTLKKLIRMLIQDIQTGLMFHEALKKYPSLFSSLFCNLIAIGEQSGTLDKIINKIAIYNEQRLIHKQKLKQTLTYPLIVLIIAICITIGLLYWVVPQFNILYTNMNTPLPLPTRILIHLSQWINAYGLITSFSLISVYIFIYQRLKHVLKFRLWKDKWLLSLPYLGNLLQQTILARFTSTLYITYTAGVPLIDALLHIINIADNILYIQATKQISQDISNGHALHIAINNTGIFPSLLIQTIAIGEVSGNLDHMLLHMANYYDDQVNYTITSLNHLLEPLIMALLGLIIGGMVMSMYLPLLNIGSVI